VHEFYGKYREQLVAHHTHEDRVFFPSLAARVGDDRMHRGELVAQHVELDAVLEAIEQGFVAMAVSDGEFPERRSKLTGDLAAMVEHLTTHLDLEERTAIPLVESEMTTAEDDDLEKKARKATTRGRAVFMIPWLAEHASPERHKAWFRSAPPLRIIYALTRRR
jgi:hemerythrin-like domain-containing protein